MQTRFAKQILPSFKNASSKLFILTSCTCVLGFGLMQPLGHVDFYPNGGKRQPGCYRNPIDLILNIIQKNTKWTAACDHFRAVSLFTDSIMFDSACRFKSYKCDSYSNFVVSTLTHALLMHYIGKFSAIMQFMYLCL